MFDRVYFLLEFAFSYRNKSSEAIILVYTTAKWVFPVQSLSQSWVKLVHC